MSRLSEQTRRAVLGHAFDEQSAEKIVRRVPDGADCMVLGFGQFSLQHWIDAWMAREPGVQGVDLAVWKVNVEGAEWIGGLVDRFGAGNVRVLLDVFFPSSHAAADWAALQRALPPESLRLVNQHSKVCVLRGTDLTVISSADLNVNRRIEYFGATRVAEFGRSVSAMFDALWQARPVPAREYNRASATGEKSKARTLPAARALRKFARSEAAKRAPAPIAAFGAEFDGWLDPKAMDLGGLDIDAALAGLAADFVAPKGIGR